MKKIVFLLALCSLGLAHGQTTIGSWKTAGELPAPQGYTESIGVSGAYAGFIGGYLVVAGGANFPTPWQLETGPQGKEFYADIFVFEVSPQKTLKLVGSGMMPQKMASGIAVAGEDRLYFVGGENAQNDSSSIYELTLKGTQPAVAELAKLPFTWSLGAAAMHEGKIYLAGGRKDRNKKGGPVNEFWAFDLKTKKASMIGEMPATARLQSPFALLGGKFYVFGGISGPNAVTDNYAYDFKTAKWAKLSNTTLKGIPFALAGGAAVPISDTKIAVIGGVNREVFNDANAQLSALKDEALIQYRVKYFGMKPSGFKFSKNIMVYDIPSNSWLSAGTVPFIGGAGPYPLVRKGDQVWHISGEIKAAVRQPAIRVGTIK